MFSLDHNALYQPAESQ